MHKYYPVLFLFGIRLGSLPLVLVAGSLLGVAFIERRLSLLILFIILLAVNVKK
jgi:hypothetical protein